MQSSSKINKTELELEIRNHNSLLEKQFNLGNKPTIEPRNLKVIVAELDFTHVDKNLQVQAQGIITCISTDGKGWFSPELERFPSRQDLAMISNVREVEL